MEVKLSFNTHSSNIELSSEEENLIFAVSSIVGTSGKILRYSKNFENKTLEIEVKLTGSNSAALQRAFSCLNNFKGMSPSLSVGGSSYSSSDDGWSNYSCGPTPSSYRSSSSCGYDSCGSSYSSSNSRC